MVLFVDSGLYLGGFLSSFIPLIKYKLYFAHDVGYVFKNFNISPEFTGVLLLYTKCLPVLLSSKGLFTNPKDVRIVGNTDHCSFEVPYWNP